jgi:hypothetical protein
MNHVNFKIKEAQNSKILVYVSVVEQKLYPLVPIVIVTTDDVMNYLESINVKVDSLITEGVAHNKRNHTRNGTWVFEKKCLDKSEKSVILKEEKIVQPKPIRKKRARSSMKKVSTEE